MIHSQVHNKIVATIGPASAKKDTLEAMIEAGVDVCRLNFSHGTHEQHLEVIKIIRAINKEKNTNVAILADLQGPKLRVGDIENDQVALKKGQQFVITSNECTGNNQRVYLNYNELAQDVEVGDNLLIDDGKIKLEVIETNQKDEVKTQVIYGGILKPRKGVNLPDTKISLPSLTEKDIKDAHFALEQEVDWLALSFVRSVVDIVELKQLIKRQKKHARVIAKIEKPEALKELDNIIDMSDGIMVARGDLGVEVDFNRVPLIQKKIVHKCVAHAKPVIIATQMMESMIQNFRPTRAEATDVANAVLDGADALMLSGETSVGAFPVEVIRNMQRIITSTEDTEFRYKNHRPPSFDRTFLADSTCFSACKLADQTKAKAIVIFTHSGYTACRVASYRPEAKLFAFTNNKNLVNQLSLVWGTQAFLLGDYEQIDDVIGYSLKFLQNNNLVEAEDIVVHVGSTPFHKKDRTNMLKISYVDVDA